MTLKGVLQNHRPPTGHRPPKTDNRPTDRSSTDPLTTDNRLRTHRQVVQRPTDHRLTDTSSNDPTATYHQLTDSPTYLQLTTNPLTHETYFNLETIIRASLF